MDSADELRFRAAMTVVADEIISRGDRRVYDIVIDHANQFVDEFFDLSHGGSAYWLWLSISDLYDAPGGPRSERLCNQIGRKAAVEWLAVDQSPQDVVDAYFRRWTGPDPWPAST